MTLPTNGKISHKDIMTEYSHPRADFKLSGDGAPILGRATNAQVKESDFYGLSAITAPPIYGGTINGMTNLPSSGGIKPQFKMDGGTAQYLMFKPQERVAYSSHGDQNYASSTGGVTGGVFLYDIDKLSNGKQGQISGAYANNTSSFPYLIGMCLDGRGASADLHHTALKHGGDSQYGRPHTLYHVRQDGSLGGTFFSLPNYPDLPQGGQGHVYREFMGQWWAKKNCWVWGGYKILKANDGTQNESYRATISFISATGGSVLGGPFDLQSTWAPYGEPYISVAGDFAFGQAGAGGSIKKFSAPGSSSETLSPLGGFGSKYEWNPVFFFKGKYYSVNGSPGVGVNKPWRVSTFTGSPEACSGWPDGWQGQWGFTSRDGTVACIHAKKVGSSTTSGWLWSTNGMNWSLLGGEQTVKCWYGFNHST